MTNETVTIEKTTEELDLDTLRSLVSLQLAGATVGRDRKIAVRELFSNIKEFSKFDLDYPTFLSMLEEIRSDFQVREGDLGVDVNYISLKEA